MKEFKHLPGLDLIRVFGILVVVFYHYQVETAVRGLCPADFLPAMEPLVQVAVYTMTLLSGSCLCWQEKSRSWSIINPILMTSSAITASITARRM